MPRLSSKLKKVNKITINDIKPFVECFNFNRLYKIYGFKFTNCTMQLYKDGWICVSLNWSTGKHEMGYLFKTCLDEGTMWSCEAVSQHLQFTLFPKDTKLPSFDVGICVKDGKPPNLNYTTKFFQNLKYGVAVYFAPSSWGSKSTTIFDYQKSFKPTSVEVKYKKDMISCLR